MNITFIKRLLLCLFIASFPFFTHKRPCFNTNFQTALVQEVTAPTPERTVLLIRNPYSLRISKNLPKALVLRMFGELHKFDFRSILGSKESYWSSRLHDYYHDCFQDRRHLPALHKRLTRSCPHRFSHDNLILFLILFVCVSIEVWHNSSQKPCWPMCRQSKTPKSKVPHLPL